MVILLTPTYIKPLATLGTQDTGHRTKTPQTKTMQRRKLNAILFSLILPKYNGGEILNAIMKTMCNTS
jgi:hypothetical protein